MMIGSQGTSRNAFSPKCAHIIQKLKEPDTKSFKVDFMTM